MISVEGLDLSPQDARAGTTEGTGVPTFSHVFRSGEITVVLGRNHAGKTRLCRAIAGLDRVNAEASICVENADVTHLPTRERPVAMVYQAFVNYPTFSVFQNLASPLRYQGLSRVQIAEEVERIAQQLQIEDLLDRLPSELSGGQQQRVAIGRALAKASPVILLDEPLANLDYKLRETLQAELRSNFNGKTVVYTTTDPVDAFALADEVVLLANHERVGAGAPETLYSAPGSLAAAHLLSDPGVNEGEDAEGLFAIRPEHIRIDENDGDRAFTVEVVACETNGSQTFLHLNCDGREWTARLPGLKRFGQTRMSVFARPEDCLRFPAEASTWQR